MFAPGLAHTPLTPFTAEQRIDFERYGKLIDFHIRSGADSLALPMHAGESISLPDAEKRALIEFAIKHVNDRVPVIAHASDAGSGIAASLARHAESMGAAAIVSTTPYYWTPPPAMLLEHFAAIGSATSLPFFVYNAPEDMAGVRITADLALKLLDRLPNFAGVVDLSLDWQFQIELMTYAPRKQPDFLLIAGNELVVSASANGAKGMFSPLAGVAPRLARQLFDCCRDDKLFEARKPQEEIGVLLQLLKKSDVAHLKAACNAMGRDCGSPRPPLQALDGTGARKLVDALSAVVALRNEPRGW